ncbi:tyrosine-type recombinase/integrase [Campylobacter insulaenigrae]|uniref:tyrosine-type recombinase/integrase n=1 Tax=Campylobacter insulaenigrae TaxID=260714 RepID=UPI00215344D1|nr:site-specific integrase [Campylobacter insulaenigrae]MCR6572034.1 tyrosine-type recombinase/integrase [Campylobacter insulaenigrae]
MAKINKLTDSFLKSVKCDNGKKFIKFSDPSIKGLYVFVYPSGRKLFKTRQANDTYITLGEYPLLSLAELREIAINSHKLKAKGQNISNAKRLKFGILYDEVLENARKSNLAAKTIQRGLSYKEGIFKSLEYKNINDIKRVDIVNILKTIEHKSATLQKAKIWINKVFEYALQLELIENNPVASIKNNIVFKKPNQVIHQPTLLDESDIKEYINTLIHSDIKQSHKNLMLFILLTAQRPGNVIKATWDEIDFKNEIWTISAQKMKMRKEHNIALSKQAISILKNQYAIKVNDYVFAGTSKKGCNSENITCNTNKRLGYKGIQSAHGFRAMFRSIANEKQLEHGVGMDIAEQCLAHEQKNAILKAYNRSKNIELKRRLMQWWGDYIEKLAGKLS